MSDIRDHAKKCGHGNLLRHDVQTGRIYGEDIMGVCPGGEKLKAETEAKAYTVGNFLIREERTTYTTPWVVVKTTSVP